MARLSKRLSARTVATATKVGRHADGDGLYLAVDASGAKRWVFLFRWGGKLKEMGLGGLASVSLAEARERAVESRRTVAAGNNPIEDRRLEVARRSEEETFGPFADALAADLCVGFKNAKHRAQWTMTLKVYAAPLRHLPLADIQTEHVLAVLKPIWSAKPETASRVRGRIERVLNAATVKGLRSGVNPAIWRGHLSELLPRRSKLTRGHHKSMPFDEVPAFVAELRGRPAVAARALEFCILNANRSAEVLGARWSEIDIGAATWTIPAARMKSGREHRIPLSPPALLILDQAGKVRTSDYVFPGRQPGAALSIMALEMMLRRMKIENATVHGFRSSFRDWCGERTGTPREVAEVALAHAVGDATERAYRRGDALEKRRALMRAWGEFCTAPAPVGGMVVAIGSRR